MGKKTKIYILKVEKNTRSFDEIKMRCFYTFIILSLCTPLETNFRMIFCGSVFFIENLFLSFKFFFDIFLKLPH